MKNDIFNFRRFGRYFSADIRTCTANYGLSLITISAFTLLVIYALTVTFNLILNGEWGGAGTIARLVIFMIVMFVIMVTMPVKCYGRLTQKQYGSFWLTLPASKLEKFLSMIVMTSVIVPFIGVSIYLCIDFLLCLLDPTCGTSIIGIIAQMDDMVHEFTSDTTVYLNQMDAMKAGFEAGAAAVHPDYRSVIEDMTSPWLYIDDMLMAPLPFLLGALVFKRSKTAKTFLSLIALGIIASILLGSFGLEQISIPKHAVLYEILSDMIMILILLAAIFYRLKTLKH